MVYFTFQIFGLLYGNFSALQLLSIHRASIRLALHKTILGLKWQSVAGEQTKETCQRPPMTTAPSAYCCRLYLLALLRNSIHRVITRRIKRTIVKEKFAMFNILLEYSNCLFQHFQILHFPNFISFTLKKVLAKS